MPTERPKQQRILKVEQKKRANRMVSEAFLAHRTRVMRLYRHSLKQMMSWAVQKSLIYEEFANIRSQFEANKNVVSYTSRKKRETTSSFRVVGNFAKECDTLLLRKLSQVSQVRHFRTTYNKYRKS